jgi:hypothetical protein
MCDVFDYGVSNAYYAVLDGRMIVKQWMGKDVEGRSEAQFDGFLWNVIPNCLNPLSNPASVVLMFPAGVNGQLPDSSHRDVVVLWMAC